MAAKDYKKSAKMVNVSPFPVNTLQAFSLGADTLETEIWNLVIEEVDNDLPIAWAVGILEKIKAEVLELEYEE